VSVRSLYRWVEAMKGSGGDIRSLIPNFKNMGNRNKKLQREVEMIIEHVIMQSFKRREKIRVNTVLEAVVHVVDRKNKDKYRPLKDKLNYPSASTVSRRIKEKGFHEMTKVKHRKKVTFEKFGTVKMQVVNGSEFNIKELKHARDMLNIEFKKN
jgi:phosphoribosylformylglycinamidine (FGAM) synthase PurS component